jgi:hypothetical protein
LARPSLGLAHGVNNKRITAITDSAGEAIAINGAACPELVSGMHMALLTRRT